MKKPRWEGALLGLLLSVKSRADRRVPKAQSQGPVPQDRPSPARPLQLWNKDFLGNVISFVLCTKSRDSGCPPHALRKAAWRERLPVLEHPPPAQGLKEMSTTQQHTGLLGSGNAAPGRRLQSCPGDRGGHPGDTAPRSKPGGSTSWRSSSRSAMNTAVLVCTLGGTTWKRMGEQEAQGKVKPTPS